MDTIAFDTLSAGDDVVFRDVTLDDFPTVSREEWFGEMRPDTGAFRDALWPRLESIVGATLELVLIAAGESVEPPHAVVYREDRQVAALTLSGDANLLDWIEQLAAPFGGALLSYRETQSSGQGLGKTAERLAEGPAEFVLSQAPQLYFEEELQAEKLAYIDLESVEVDDSFDEDAFKTALGGFLEHVDAEPTGPAPEDRFSPIDASLENVHVPQELHALYDRINGSEGLFFGHDLMTAEQVVEQWSSWVWIFDDWTLEELQDWKSSDGNVLPIYCCPAWIPFIDLVGGHYLAVDLAPQGDGSYGQVIAFGRDIETNRKVADSITELLEICATYDNDESHALWSIFGALAY